MVVCGGNVLHGLAAAAAHAAISRRPVSLPRPTRKFRMCYNNRPMLRLRYFAMSRDQATKGDAIQRTQKELSALDLRVAPLPDLDGVPGFGELLGQHLARGTRPDGTPEQPGRMWTTQAFAHAVGYSDRAVRHWLSDRHLPADLETIERVLFGPDYARYPEWRLELRKAHVAALSVLEPATIMKTEPQEAVEKAIRQEPEWTVASQVPEARVRTLNLKLPGLEVRVNVGSIGQLVSWLSLRRHRAVPILEDRVHATPKNMDDEFIPEEWEGIKSQALKLIEADRLDSPEKHLAYVRERIREALAPAMVSEPSRHMPG
jgi:hypothetical protein